MDKKQRKSIWRKSVFFTLVIALIYRIVEMFIGTFPPLNEIVFLLKSGFSPVGSFSIKLPWDLSWWWNLAFAFIVTAFYVYLGLKKTEKDKLDINFYTFFIISAILSMGISQYFGVSFYFSMALVYPIPIYFFYSKINALRAALFLSLILNAITGFLNGIIEFILFMAVYWLFSTLTSMRKSKSMANFKTWINGGIGEYKMRIVRIKTEKK